MDKMFMELGPENWVHCKTCMFYIFDNDTELVCMSKIKPTYTW